ncbi:hypothetical protein GCM10010977_23970 [Citricoccus zhacaiensis]|uniref:Excalibur calcium-binding domain-containing protein n=1 Tax=Citricoccus zhacaiensis TaxID=489142 RepID=A0ABQ2M5U6_9MICC|nr:excalibur calcium-binding domain-containing protein [Citricoccus zhacaiensis]GGO47227.1 hypothetical protein GCM10010977_23970 [Citricoccus zhacaiensis]
MNTLPGADSAQNASANRRRWLIIGLIALAVLILLLVFAPVVLMLLCIPAFIIALIALIAGGLRWARIRNRRVAGGLVGGTFVLFIIAAVVFSTSLPASTTDPITVSEEPTPTISTEPELASFVGEACDADHLIMTQGADTLYCDDDGQGEFVWFTAADHEAAEVEAQKVAAEQAAAEKEAAEKAAAEKEAADKAAAEEAAQKAAAEKAAADKVAEEKAAADRAAQAESERKAEAEAERQATREREAAPAPAPEPARAPASAYYANCSEARAAGAAPVYRGDPGYSKKLDRDGDGVGCE